MHTRSEQGAAKKGVQRCTSPYAQATPSRASKDSRRAAIASLESHSQVARNHVRTGSIKGANSASCGVSKGAEVHPTGTRADREGARATTRHDGSATQHARARRQPRYPQIHTRKAARAFHGTCAQGAQALWAQVVFLPRLTRGAGEARSRIEGRASACRAPPAPPGIDRHDRCCLQ